MDIKNVLVATDFSKYAGEALKFSRLIAEKCSPKIFVVHVFLDFRTHYAQLLGTNVPQPEAYEEEERRAVSKLREETDKLRHEGFDAEEVMLFGTPYVEILKFAENREMDLIILGAKGLSGIKELLLGSTALKVVRNAHIPVVTVKACPSKIEKILFPTDLSDLSFEALPMAFDFCRKMGASITLFHVIEITTYDPARAEYFLSDKFFEELIPSIESKMGPCPEDVKYERKVERALDATAAILDEIRDNNYDLTIMATHGRTGFKRALLGSVTEKIVRYSPAPVMTVKPKEFAKK